MMRFRCLKISFLVFPLFFPLLSIAQDTILHRILFIGDAGQINPIQQQLMHHASDQVLPGKTSVFFLGDNIYPKGMGKPGSKTAEDGKKILRSQFAPFRQKGAPVYFIPGNHDWDNSGTKGLASIKAQDQFIQEQGDSLIQLLPANGCPGPIELNITDSLVVIVFDSEWWLYPFNKIDPSAECDCRTKEDMIAKLTDMLFRNRHKLVFLTSHHPFQSYGNHGGYFSWKDHLFPLTALNKDLYIPIPIIGSLYPIFRSIFSGTQDLKHPLYKNMIQRVDETFALQENRIHISGHEHNQQLITDKQTQIVTGAGSNSSFVKKGVNSLFADERNGYLIADLLPGNQLRFTFQSKKDTGFEISYTYLRNFIPTDALDEFKGPEIEGDSIRITPHDAFEKVSKTHRFLFGENYRKDYALPVTLPVIRLSKLEGGSMPVKLGGGTQSKTLRLKDPNGKEWILRTVDKYPQQILPQQVQQTFAGELLSDAISAQYPYAALTTAPIANAFQVPHTNPKIGYVAADDNLGIYIKNYANRLALLEEREPAGKSISTIEMLNDLNKDNDNKIDKNIFLRARLLDLFIGDWDRHDDQWRWVDMQKGKGKNFLVVPRDRDQSMHVTEGMLPNMLSKPWNMPFLHNFNGDIKRTEAFFYEGRNLNARFLNEFTRKDWQQISDEFIQAVTDSVLEAALHQLPTEAYQFRHQSLLDKWKTRRSNLSQSTERYYQFLNKIVDIQTSDKNELVQIDQEPEQKLHVIIHKIAKDGKIEDKLFDRVFEETETKEIRLYIRKGKDSVILNNGNSPIRLRIIGGEDKKVYQVLHSEKRIDIYEGNENTQFKGNADHLVKHISSDSNNTRFIPTNLYNVFGPVLAGGFNEDDGLILGAGFKHVKKDGFRSQTFSSTQQFTAQHSFSTRAYQLKYKGEWIRKVGTADLMLNMQVNAPGNTLNYFGRGNETEIDKKDGYKTYYRTRFGTYALEPSLRWNGRKGSTFLLGPSLNFYDYNEKDNEGRFISDPSHIGSYDSSTVKESKLHLGVVAQYINDRRSNPILPTWGSLVNLKMMVYKGVGRYANDYAQFIPEFSFYTSLDNRSSFVLAERFGGTISLGKPAFYQSAFIGGQGNLQGYQQYRFAGQHSFYNNLELRVKLADLASYIVPGQYGLSLFWDVGRVWDDQQESRTWHHGTGAGIYFAPASLLVFNFMMGHSEEGWLPYFTIGFRF